MRERARVLDSRYLEFIEYLQKLGELQSITRMIAKLCGQEDVAIKRSEKYRQEHVQGNTETSKMMYIFWKKRWIEVREIEKKRDNGLFREYIVKLSLKEIVDYLAEAEMRRSGKSGSSAIPKARPRCPPKSASQYSVNRTPLAA
jgi:predicted transcriptional regulator